jgi:transcription initiation factor TFIIF subunit beta
VTPNPGSPEYREIMRERTLEANKKGGRHVQILGDTSRGADAAGGRGGMFLPGMGVRNGFIVSQSCCLLMEGVFFFIWACNSLT